jgi:hypothetical protein
MVIKLRKTKWSGYVACMEQMRNAPKYYSQVLKGSVTGIPRRKWKANIEIDVEKLYM